MTTDSPSPPFSPRRLLAAAAAAALAGGAALAASVAFFPFTTNKVDTALGRQVFQRNCSGCHALREAAPAGYGPTLSAIGAVGGQRIPGMSAEEYIFESIVRPAAFKAAPGGEMSPDAATGLSIEELRSLTAFLCAQGGAVDYSRILALARPESESSRPWPKVSLASIERGRKLFQQELKCTNCHALDEAPGSQLAAPSLLKVGLNGRDQLRQSVLTPSAQVSARYIVHAAIDVDGVVHQGLRLPSDDGDVRLVSIAPEGGMTVTELPKEDLEPFDDGQVTRPLATSLMPTPNEGLAPDDLESLLDFLQTLR